MEVRVRVCTFLKSFLQDTDGPASGNRRDEKFIDNIERDNEVKKQMRSESV